MLAAAALLILFPAVVLLLTDLLLLLIDLQPYQHFLFQLLLQLYSTTAMLNKTKRI